MFLHSFHLCMKSLAKKFGRDSQTHPILARLAGRPASDSTIRSMPGVTCDDPPFSSAIERPVTLPGPLLVPVPAERLMLGMAPWLPKEPDSFPVLPFRDELTCVTYIDL